ncbi:ATP-binding protein [Mesorhizobium sp. WSM4312]|uniref:AAA family ATPase n=1 Tax=Mesorhizobium sp. WSM4312 TaxID=2029411 RepID=UPI00117E9F36|nr:ATP-binding protein [Mesorhizobium sp. WSM4312]
METYTPFGAAGHVVTRMLPEEIVSLLRDESGPRVILLSGVAGSGKSGVVRDVLDRLTTEGTLHLALRIDQHLQCKTSADLGESLFGRSESPTTMLKGLAPDDTTVLLIDQIDAVSEVSGRNGATKNAILRMLDEAQRYATVRVVLICRSFDIESDERIKQLRQADGVVQIDVPLLDWAAEVVPVIAALGVSPDALDATQKALLCLPLNLAVFADIASDGDTQFASRNDLFAKLLQRKERLIATNRDQASWSLMAALTELAHWMSDRQRLDAPFSVLDGFPRCVDILASEHLIVRSRGTVNFFHESFFDYIFARAFAARTQTLVELLTSTEQHLFRRTQVRQILESLRQSDPFRYLRELKQVITTSDIRFHIKIAVVQWLAALSAPTEQERDIVLAMDVSDQPFSVPVRTAFQGSAGWFDVLHPTGWIAAQLASAIEARKRAVLWWLGNIAGTRAQPIAQILDTWWDGDGARGAELLNWFGYVRRQGPDQALIDLCQRVIQARPPGLFDSKGNFRRELLIATWAGGESNAGAAAILKAYFDAWFDEYPDVNPFEREEIRDVDLHSLGELGKKAPLALLDGSIDALARAFGIIANKIKAGGFDYSFSHRAYRGHNSGSDKYLEFIRAALRKVAAQDPNEARRILHRLDPQSHEAAAHLYLETITANPKPLAGELLPLLSVPTIFHAGWIGAGWRSFADAAKAAMPYLDEASLMAVENAILSHRPELDYAVRSAKQLKAGDKDALAWKTPKRVVGQLAISGQVEFCILETIGRDLLSSRASRRLDELQRKFRTREVQQPTNVRPYSVESPIDKDSAALMTDEQWLSALQAHNEDNERHYGNGSATGGALQLAQVLQQLTKEHPERFARLQLLIPGNANQAFIRQLLWGLAEAETVELEPLEASVIDAHAREGRPFGEGVVRLIGKHPELGRSQTCWDILVWHIANGDASDSEEIDIDHTERETVSIDMLLDQAGKLYIRGLNGTRGWALEALAAILWHIPERRADSWPLLADRIKAEPKISIRCCIPNPITPMFNEDKVRCAALLETLAEGGGGVQRSRLAAAAIDRLNFPPLWVHLSARRLLTSAGQRLARGSVERQTSHSEWLSPLITHSATNLLPYIVHQVPTVGRRLLSKLLSYGNPNMRLVATWHVICASYNDADYVALADTLENASLDARRLAADIASHSILHDTFRDRAARNLRRYFDDDDKSVRNEAAGLFREIPADQFFAFIDLAKVFVASKAFETNSFALLHALENATCNVSGLVIAAAERVLRELSADRDAANRRDMDIHQINDLIKNEYASSEDDPALRKRLLDVIDQMLMLELYGVDEITRTHER